MKNFLLKDGILDYSSVYIYSSTLYQPSYEYLKEYYEEIENMIKKKFNINTKIAHFIAAEDDEEFKNPSELDPSTNHVMVFDDVMLKDQTKIKEYFCMGRHSNINVFYLVQSLHKIPKQCIRDNANIFILFHQDQKTLKYFHGTHISADMDFTEFKKFCDAAWSVKHGSVVINKWEAPYCGRYISNYSEIHVPSKYSEKSKKREKK